MDFAAVPLPAPSAASKSAALTLAWSSPPSPLFPYPSAATSEAARHRHALYPRFLLALFTCGLACALTAHLA